MSCFAARNARFAATFWACFWRPVSGAEGVSGVFGEGAELTASAVRVSSSSVLDASTAGSVSVRGSEGVVVSSGGSVVRLSAEGEGEFDITYKYYPGGKCSGYLESLKVGDEIQCFAVHHVRACYQQLRAGQFRWPRQARQDSAEDFSRLNALLFTAMAWIFIPAYCFAIP